MPFMKLDVRAVLRKESGLSPPRAARFLIGNPFRKWRVHSAI
jgi:hypothetical protein